MTEAAGWILCRWIYCLTIFSQIQQRDWMVLCSTGGQWPKTYCKSNPGVFEVKEPEWGCISLAEDKTKGRKTHKQTTEDSCLKGLAKHYEEGNQWIDSILNKILKMNILFMIILFWPITFEPLKIGGLCVGCNFLRLMIHGATFFWAVLLGYFPHWEWLTNLYLDTLDQSWALCDP